MGAWGVGELAPLHMKSSPLYLAFPGNFGGASCCLTIECDIRAMALV